LEILSGFAHINYLLVIDLEENRGFCNALNIGIEKASAKYIMRADPDDIISNNRVKYQYEYLENNKNIDVLGSNAYYFNNNPNNIITKSNFPTDHTSIKSRYLKGEHGVLHATTMSRSSVIKKYRYNQENVKAEDYEIFSKIIADGYKFANLSESLYGVRVHTESASTNIEYSTIKMTFKIRDDIFKTYTNSLKVRLYFWHILNYRKYLISKNILLKPFFLTLSIICYPSKLVNRFI